MSSFRNFFSCALAVVLLAACAPQPALSLAQSALPRLTDPNVPSEDLQALVNGNNALALDLYHALPRGDNLIFSPYSISLALAMTYAGARGDTASQMAQALHFALPESVLHAAFNRLDLSLMAQGARVQEDEQPFRLNIANALWAQKDHSFLPAYLDLLALHYGAGVHLADFARSEAVRREINAWVSRQTEDRIQDLIPAGALDALTRLVLVNAIYFKADWEMPFDAEATSDAPFYLLDGSQIAVPMMSADLTVRYGRGPGYQVIELPYKGGAVAMDILLPEEGQFESFAAGLNIEQLNLMLGSLEVQSIQLHLPRFHFTRDFELSSLLSSLGMENAFDPNLADFSGMDGERDLYIGRVIHKAFVAVDEKGTEAAAATAVVMRLTAVLPPETVVTVDRPFVFLIRNLVDGQILFFGQVLNPLQ